MLQVNPRLPAVLSLLYQHEELLPAEICAVLRSGDALENKILVQVLFDLADAIKKIDKSLPDKMKIMVLKEYTVQLLKNFS